MIITANKYVNARLGRPFTDAPNPSFLQPGDQIDVVKRVYGECIEGCNEWYLNSKGDFYTSKGFKATDKIKEVPVANNSSLFYEWKIADAWKMPQGKGKGIRIAIIDKGFNLLNKAIKDNDNYPIGRIDDHFHGTYMASIISGSDYEGGYLGLVPEATIFYNCIDVANFTQSDLYNCLLNLYKLKNIDIVSMSFSRKDSDFIKPELNKRLFEIMDKMIREHNTIFLASVGNDGISKKKYPAAFGERVISVAGHDKKQNLINRDSNMWEGVSIISPFQGYFDKSINIVADFQLPDVKSQNGTSSSTAFMVGILAIIKNLHYAKYNEKLNETILRNKYFDVMKVSHWGRVSERSDYTTSIIRQSTFFNLIK